MDIVGRAIVTGIALIIVVSMVVRIMREYERIVIFRLGRCKGEKGPGIKIIIPLIDKTVRVNLQERYFDVPEQTCITKDNANINIDFLIYYKIVNSVDSVVQVANWEGACRYMAITSLRAVVGDISLDDVLAKRDEINQALRVKLDEVTGRWGVKVTAVEIREIRPPQDIQEAMTRQISAERNRRAVVTEADCKREAAIKVAEGEKQAIILRAEGNKQSAILQAEGMRQAAILNAEGYALALDKIFSAAKNVDEKTMALQYLETLKNIGAGPSTKFVVPMEFTNLIKPFTNYTDKAK